MLKESTVSRFVRGLQGRKMVNAERRGKYLIVTLDNGHYLILHFGMGGDLHLYRAESDQPAFTRIDFILDGKDRLAFTCPRKICRVMLVNDINKVPALRDMGPEPLGTHFSLSYLQQLLERSPRRLIKPLLMDQTRIAGVGNIYADEILFESGVLPYRRCSTLSKDEIKRIHRETRRVLRRALGTAVEEEFPRNFLVSRNSDGPGCTRCGGSIERETIGGLTAYFCPRCQE
jgi:formamidopyrimidine-DNA glycosylase